VEPSLFRTLGTSAAVGRTLRDDDIADTVRMVVLTHPAWRRLFGGDRAVVGKDVVINGITRTVVGVMPREFVGPVDDVDVYYALSLEPFLRDPVRARQRQWAGIVGRLKPGVTVDAAQRDLGAIYAESAKLGLSTARAFGVSVVPVRDDMVGETRTPLLALMASAGLVLLITCANLAGALLSRAISRRKEFAVRTALGGGRGRLVRQLLTESVLLAAAGGAVGIALAALGLAVLRRLSLPALPAYAELALDPGAVAVTSLVALLTGVAVGLAPALSASRGSPQATLRDEARGASESGRSRSLRGVLVAGQIALCVSLLTGAGLLARSLWAMAATPFGFDPDGVLAVAVNLPGARYGDNAARVRFFDRFEEQLRAIPGVRSVASAGEVPTRMANRNGLTPVGAPALPDDAGAFQVTVEVSDDYFRTLRIPLRHGRTFGPQDREGSDPTIVISESVARRFWPNGNAVGARAWLDKSREGPQFTVIGVVGDIRKDPSRGAPEPMMYMSIRHAPWNGPVFMIRTTGDPLALARPVRAALAAVDPGLPLQQPMTLRAMIGESLSGRRLPVVLMTAFGALALALASVGVYAMFAGMAAAREREFGVRVALGSSRARIAALVLRQGGTWMALGLAGGALGVVLITRTLQGLLYGVSRFDPLTLAGAAFILLACGAIALLVPVRRATRVDPISTLR
jgi:putative ABC transport system permease protein